MRNVPKLTAQAVGRMGELAVEMDLLARGWTVGNFNATTKNTAGFDLFAVSGRHDVKLRVKAKRRGVDSWQWTAKPDGKVFLNLTPRDPSDFTALVSFDDTPHGYTIYILPTQVLDQAIKRDFKEFCARNPTMPSGEQRSPATHRHRALRLNSPSRGLAKKWKRYRENWDLLEGPNLGR
jgi:hypothetical protein